MTHDYKRHGTATLFAALDVLTRQSYRAMPAPAPPVPSLLKFLRTIDREVPDELAVHLICDDYATHKHQSVRAWLDKHPRFQPAVSPPTSSSWLNLVERWFRELTDKALRRGVFHSVPDLIAKIEDYLTAHNNDPKPFVCDRHRPRHPRQSRPRTRRAPSGQPMTRHSTSWIANSETAMAAASAR